MLDEPQVRSADHLAGLDPQGLMQLALPEGDGPGDAPAGFVPPEPHELAACFPELEILELIGRGGMGCVYKARQKHLDRLVALKILPPELGDDPAFAERFTREARTLARLVHPNIVTIHDFGQTCGLSYLVMEYVDGMNLRERLQSDGLSPAEVLPIIPRLCDALQYAHDEGVVHRDIKPENILFDRRGHVKLADFGLAKLVAAAAGGETVLTQSRQTMGTPYYMAPEQWRSPHAVDHRADIYALGVVCYEMLTGQLPLGRFDPPSHKVAVDGRLDEILLRAMQGEPQARYQRADELGQDVDYVARTANDPLRIVPQLPRRMRTLLPGVVEAAQVALRPAVRLLKSFAAWLREFWREFPFPTVAACGFIAAVTALPWVVASEIRPTIWDPIGRVVQSEPVERAFVGYETWTRLGGMNFENYWPAVAAGVIAFLALFRRRLGLRSELLSVCLCLYGMAHIYFIYESRQYGAYWQRDLRDAQLTAAPLVVGATFAVLLVGNLVSMAWRICVSAKGQRSVGSLCRSFGRLLISECRDV